VRPVSLSLLVGTIVGSMASGFATGPASFLFGQFLLGVATVGNVDVPDDAGRKSRCRRQGSACGPELILSIGNIGMLLSSSPLAFVVEHLGWRAGFWLSARFSASAVCGGPCSRSYRSSRSFMGTASHHSHRWVKYCVSACHISCAG